MFLAGAGVYIQTYDAQAILPRIGFDLAISSTSSVLLLSATTVGMALGVMPWAYVSDHVGRLTVIRSCLLLATLIALITPFIPEFVPMLAVRLIKGVLLGGVTGLAVTFLFEQLPAARAVIASGIYISGNTVGGVATRVLSGFIAQSFGWRISLEVIAVLSLILVVAFAYMTRGLRAQNSAPRNSARGGLWRSLWRSGVMLSFAQGFVALGVFNALFSVIPFRLHDAAPELSPTLTSLVLGLYAVAFIPAQVGGRIAASIGIKRVFVIGYILAFSGLGLLFVPNILGLIFGVSVLVLGTFLVHPLSSAESGQRMPNHRAQSTALYQISWLSGATIISPLGTSVYAGCGWEACIGLLVSVLLSGALAAITDQRLARRAN